MSHYIQLLFENITPVQSELLIASLSEVGYEGFEEEVGSLKAFITAGAFQEDEARAIAQQVGVTFSQTIIEETNWNEVWESNFQPVVVEAFAGIRAGFHQPLAGVQHEIVITPKMSFGTGHHATTYMMIMQMRGIDFTGLSVLDFGTGTGILAILSEKLGAKDVLAIDNDDWSIENAKENISQNNCSRIAIQEADSAMAGRSFDVILANINKNVILDNFSTLAKQLGPGGVLILSGLLKDDEADILGRTRLYGLKPVFKLERHNWLSLSLSY